MYFEMMLAVIFTALVTWVVWECSTNENDCLEGKNPCKRD